MQTHIITGNTYPARRELRALGAIWNADAKGYVVPPQHSDRLLAYVANRADLEASPFEATDDDVTPATGERLRALRQNRMDRRAARLRTQADNAEKRAEKALARVSPAERDFLSLMEPVKRGHHSQRRHEKLLDKAQKSFMDAGREYSEAEKLRNRADSIGTAQIKGDAERRRQAAREAGAALIDIGDKVRCIIFGEGVVIKANKNTFTVKFESRGFTQNCDKGGLKLIEKGNGAVSVEYKFAVGDKVTATRIQRGEPGIVRRRSARGYTVELESGRKEFFQEYQLAARETEKTANNC